MKITKRMDDRPRAIYNLEITEEEREQLMLVIDVQNIRGFPIMGRLLKYLREI